MTPYTSVRLALAVTCLLPTSLLAADLTPRTTAAFDRYVRTTEARMDAGGPDGPFLWIDSLPPGDRAVRLDALRRGALVIERLQTRDGSRTIDVPDALVHHWVGLAFVPGVSLGRTMALLQDYDRHARVYAPRIAESRLQSHEGDTFRFHLRFVMAKVITVVMDSDNLATFATPSAGRAVGRIASTRIEEVDNAGTPDERRKPVGHDSGYLWRLNTYWRMLERDGGTYVQCESVSLTRGIPAGLGWLIGPMVTSLPRESLEFTLNTTRRTLTTP